MTGPTRTDHPAAQDLDDLVDGVLAEEARARVETHLEICPTCRGTVEDLRALLARVGALPSIPPSRDLWPGIARAVRPAGPGFRRYWLGLAASLLAVAAAGIVGWKLGSDPRTTAAPGARTQATADVLEEFLAAERAYVEAGNRLLAALDEHPHELPAASREALERNLAVIDRAIDEARNALRADPGDAAGGRLLTALQKKRMKLLWTAARLSS